MGKHPQNRFTGLKIVASTNKKPRPAHSAPRWWGPRSTRSHGLGLAANTTPDSAHEIHMMILPTLSRNLLLMAIAWMWNFLRGYFAAPKAQPRAAVLAFRRHAAWAQENFASKKASGSVRWNSDCEVAPQEGGRG